MESRIVSEKVNNRFQSCNDFMSMKDTHICRAVIELQGLRQLLALLKSAFSAIQQLALKTLQVISTCEESQSAFRDARLFDELIEILNNQVGVQCVAYIVWKKHWDTVGHLIESLLALRWPKNFHSWPWWEIVDS